MKIELQRSKLIQRLRKPIKVDAELDKLKARAQERIDTEKAKLQEKADTRIETEKQKAEEKLKSLLK